jgi:hypothetical protein
VAAKPKKPKKRTQTNEERVRRFQEILGEFGPCYYLNKRRLDPCRLAKEIEAHLEATQVKVFHHQGEIIFSDPLIDWQTRGRALELAVKLWGMIPAEKKEFSIDGNINLSSLTDDQLDERIARAICEAGVTQVAQREGAAPGKEEA